MAFSFKNIYIRVTKLWQVFLFSLLKKVQKFVVYVICVANVEQSVTINMPVRRDMIVFIDTNGLSHAFIRRLYIDKYQ